MIYRRNFLTAAAGVLTASYGSTGRPPNIVFILGDDLGYGDLGCYGQEKILTPNLDRLAGEGLRFTQCYAGGPVCAPSRSVLMSGLHGGHAPIRANAGTQPLSAEDTTVAEVLKKSGYTTAGFGKWGLGDARSSGIPGRHGFDEFFGYLHQVHAHSYYPDFLWDNTERYEMPKGAYSADVIFERSLEFVRKNRAKPFFLYQCGTLPHARFEPPDTKPYQDRPWTQGQKAYASMVTRLDAQVGRLRALLRELSLDADTLLFFTSDNGAHSGEDKGFEFFRSNGTLRGEKGQLFEGGLRVPMIACWKGHIRAGTNNDVPWSFCDVLPTLAQAAGAKIPEGLDGLSMMSALLGGKLPQRRFLYWENNAWIAKTKQLDETRLGQAVRLGDWKAIRKQPGTQLELYHLARDPGETTDVASAHPEVIGQIEGYLRTARSTPRPHNLGDMQYLR